MMCCSVGEPASDYDVNDCENTNAPGECCEMLPLLAVLPQGRQRANREDEKDEKPKPNKKGIRWDPFV